MALELSFMMEAWASLSNTVRSDFLVSTFWGRNISFTQRGSSIWPTMSRITEEKICIHKRIILTLEIICTFCRLCFAHFLGPEPLIEYVEHLSAQVEEHDGQGTQRHGVQVEEVLGPWIMEETVLVQVEIVTLLRA